MPKFMKNKAISLISAGIETYQLGLYGLTLPTAKNKRHQEIKFVPVMGLFGSATELLIKACLVQAVGSSAMYKQDDSKNEIYVYTSECIENLKYAIMHEDLRCSFLWDVDDKEAQKNQLIYFLKKIKLLQVVRANALHGGEGCSRDIAVVTANDIYDFIQTLAKAKRLHPYLKNVVAPESTVKDREAIIEDLSRRLSTQKNPDEKMSVLRGIYLVLPYVPENEPDWVSKLEHVDVVPPSKDDINYLIKSLNEAHSIYLLKNRGGKEGIPVKVEPNNPDALPISIQNIKRVLSNIPDQFRNDALTANTRLQKNLLDLPISDFLIDLFALDLKNAGVLTDGNFLTASDVWAFVVSAYSTQGTPRPCWDLIMNCDELDKLISILKKVKCLGNGYYKRRADMLIQWVSEYKNHLPFSINDDICERSDKVFKEAIVFAKEDPVQEFSLSPQVIRAMPLSDEVAPYVQAYIQEKSNIGEYIEKILMCKNLTNNDKQIVIMMMRQCNTYDQRNGVVAVLRSDQMISHRSEARKRMFFIDVKHAEENIQR